MSFGQRRSKILALYDRGVSFELLSMSKNLTISGFKIDFYLGLLLIVP